MMFGIDNKKCNVTCLSLWLFLCTGCGSEFLEVLPKGVIIASNTSDYERLLGDTQLSFLTRASHVVMSDELCGFAPLYAVGSGIASVSDQNAFEYKDDIYLLTQNTAELTQLESQLYLYNKVINEVMSAGGGTDTQKKALRAEALAGRAWVHFMLVNYYGKPYDFRSAKSDPGVPLVTVADVTQTVFTRATVQEAYDLIIADLTQAIPDLPPVIFSRHRMSKAAAQAILGKVYMYMQQFDQALPLLSASIVNLSNGTIPIGLYNFNDALNEGGAFCPIDPIFGPNRFFQNIDKEVLYLKSYRNIYSSTLSGIPMAPKTVALYTEADLRRKFLTPSVYPAIVTTFPAGVMRGYGRSPNLGVNISDIYLLKAECESRMGNLAIAVADLVAFRKTRMVSNMLNAADIPTSIASDQVALTQFILEERVREFAGTGERWWDMRRLFVDEEYRSTVKMVHHVYDANGAVVQSFPLRPERLTFRFPQFIINANPDIPQNP